MKNIIILLTIIIPSFFLHSCEEVVNVDLKTEAPRLVVDAGINWYKGTAGNEQKIKLTTTTDYYSHTIPVVLGATVSIKNAATKI